jgi:hypothetical protein
MLTSPMPTRLMIHCMCMRIETKLCGFNISQLACVICAGAYAYMMNVSGSTRLPCSARRPRRRLGRGFGASSSLAMVPASSVVAEEVQCGSGTWANKLVCKSGHYTMIQCGPCMVVTTLTPSTPAAAMARCALALQCSPHSPARFSKNKQYSGVQFQGVFSCAVPATSKM